MSEDPIAVLERELVDAARRRASVRPERRRRLNIGALAVAALVAVTLAVAGGALILLAGHKRPAASTATNRSRQQLIDILAVLRRPQTKTDLDPELLRQLSRNRLLGLHGTPDRPLIRLAAVTPWGEKVFLVPMKPLTASATSSLQGRHPLSRRLPLGLAQRTGETLAVYFTDANGSGGRSCCNTAGRIEAGSDGPGIEGFRPAHGSGYTRLTSVVPDGVAKVVFNLPRQGGAEAPVYKHTLTVATQVHGNVAAVQVARQCCSGPIPTIWYGTNGQVIKRFGKQDQAVPAAPAKECGAKQVRLQRPTQVDGLLGTEVIPVVITNVSSRPCSISGYPRIQLLNTRHRPVALKIAHGALGPKEPKRVSTVVLAPPKGRATFSVSFVDHPGPVPTSDCRKFHFIRATLPGQHVALTTTSGVPTEVCDGRPNPWLYVSPIGA
jgi:hypothetical protein